MAGLPVPFIQTVAAKVHLLQSFVLGNISLEDIQVQVSRGPVSRAVSGLSLERENTTYYDTSLLDFQGVLLTSGL